MSASLLYFVAKESQFHCRALSLWKVDVGFCETAHGGNWVSGSAGMATPFALLAQTFMSITCFGRISHMNDTLTVLADKKFVGFWSILGISGYYINGGWVPVGSTSIINGAGRV